MDSQYYVAAAINFVGAILLQSNVYIILRKLKSLHFSVVLTVFGAVGALESFILMMTVGDGCVPQCGIDRSELKCLYICKSTPFTLKVSTTITL